MKKLLPAGVLAGCLILLSAGTASASAAPAQEPPDTPLDCEFEIGLEFGAPLGGHVWTESGTFSCVGERIRGHRITGPGDYTLTGEYAGACAAGVIDGVYELVLPTNKGPLELSDDVSIEWGPFAGHLNQQMGNKSFDGGFGGIPTTGGPCLGGRADVMGAGVLR